MLQGDGTGSAKPIYKKAEEGFMVGFSSIPVDDYTSPAPVFVQESTTIEDVMKLMRENNIRHIPVVEGKKAVGIISDRDVKLALTFDPSEKSIAKQIMVANPYAVTAEESLESVAFELSKNKFGSAIIENEKGEITGIFTVTDALNALIEVLRGENES
jgi:acetoin utilization protein AcuB